MSQSAELVIDARAMLAEGPVWHAQRQLLYWVSILASEVHVFDPATNEDRAIDVGQFVGTVVPRKSGGVIVALHHGIASLDLDTGDLKVLADPEADQPGNRFNDGKCDPAGRFWAGTMSLTYVEGAGSLYMMDADLSVRPMLGNVTISNGIVWSPDRSTMYYIDTPTCEVSAFDYAVETGAISNRRTAVRIPKDLGGPDGMTIDAEGKLWVAVWGSGAVSRWDPESGEMLGAVSLPVTAVSACAFGGPNLDELYVTTAREGMDEQALAEQPHAGGVFRVKPGVCGVEAFEFAG